MKFVETRRKYVLLSSIDMSTQAFFTANGNNLFAHVIYKQKQLHNTIPSLFRLGPTLFGLFHIDMIT